MPPLASNPRPGPSGGWTRYGPLSFPALVWRNDKHAKLFCHQPPKNASHGHQSHNSGLSSASTDKHSHCIDARQAISSLNHMNATACWIDTLDTAPLRDMMSCCNSAAFISGGMGRRSIRREGEVRAVATLLGPDIGRRRSATRGTYGCSVLRVLLAGELASRFVGAEGADGTI